MGGWLSRADPRWVQSPGGIIRASVRSPKRAWEVSSGVSTSPPRCLWYSVGQTSRGGAVPVALCLLSKHLPAVPCLPPAHL